MAEQRKKYSDANVHVTLIIGTIPTKYMKKEELSIPGMQLTLNDSESLDSGRNSSFDIILSQLIKFKI